MNIVRHKVELESIVSNLHSTTDKILETIRDSHLPLKINADILADMNQHHDRLAEHIQSCLRDFRNHKADCSRFINSFIALLALIYFGSQHVECELTLALRRSNTFPWCKWNQDYTQQDCITNILCTIFLAILLECLSFIINHPKDIGGYQEYKEYNLLLRHSKKTCKAFNRLVDTVPIINPKFHCLKLISI